MLIRSFSSNVFNITKLLMVYCTVKLHKARNYTQARRAAHLIFGGSTEITIIM